MARFSKWCLGVLKSPPPWMRFAGLVLVPLIGTAIAQRRDAVIGVVCAALAAGIFIPTAFSFERMRLWSQRHPVLDALASAPILFVCCVYFFPHLALWWCIAIAVAVALPLGVVKAVQHKRPGGAHHGPAF